MFTHKIKILAPIDRIEEALPLIKAGADEFFCGVVIDGDDLGGPRRERDMKTYNVPSITEFEKLLAIIRNNKKKIFLAFNRPTFNLRRREIIANNIKRLRDLRIDGFIISDIESINSLKDYNINMIASSFLETKNEETVKFLKKFNIKRIIFDRQVTLDDVKNIVPNFPETEFETFIIEEGCRSLASACQWRLVTKGGHRRHLCYVSSLIDGKNGAVLLKPGDKEIIAERLKMPFKCCGACALWQFKKYGIASVKIVGRGNPTELKVMDTKFIKATLEILEKNYSQEKFYQKTQKLFEEIFHEKCNKQYCYYPHFF